MSEAGSHPLNPTEIARQVSETLHQFVADSTQHPTQQKKCNECPIRCSLSSSLSTLNPVRTRDFPALFVGVECRERWRQAAAYRTFVEPWEGCVGFCGVETTERRQQADEAYRAFGRAVDAWWSWSYNPLSLAIELEETATPWQLRQPFFASLHVSRRLGSLTS